MIILLTLVVCYVIVRFFMADYEANKVTHLGHWSSELILGWEADHDTYVLKTPLDDMMYRDQLDRWLRTISGLHVLNCCPSDFGGPNTLYHNKKANVLYWGYRPWSYEDEEADVHTLIFEKKHQNAMDVEALYPDKLKLHSI